MVFLFILIILIGTLPLLKTVRYIRLEERIRRNGISTSGIVTSIKTTRYQRGPATDRVHVRYGSIIPGQYHTADFVAKYGKYRTGDSVPVKYLPEKTDKIVVAEKRGYWLMLIFSIALLLFVFFAVYKIHEMVKADGGYT